MATYTYSKSGKQYKDGKATGVVSPSRASSYYEKSASSSSKSADELRTAEMIYAKNVALATGGEYNEEYDPLSQTLTATIQKGVVVQPSITSTTSRQPTSLATSYSNLMTQYKEPTNNIYHSAVVVSPLQSIKSKAIDLFKTDTGSYETRQTMRGDISLSETKYFTPQQTKDSADWLSGTTIYKEGVKKVPSSSSQKKIMSMFTLDVFKSPFDKSTSQTIISKDKEQYQEQLAIFGTSYGYNVIKETPRQKLSSLAQTKLSFSYKPNEYYEKGMLNLSGRLEKTAEERYFQGERFAGLEAETQNKNLKLFYGFAKTGAKGSANAFGYSSGVTAGLSNLPDVGVTALKGLAVGSLFKTASVWSAGSAIKSGAVKGLGWAGLIAYGAIEAPDILSQKTSVKKYKEAGKKTVDLFAFMTGAKVGSEAVPDVGGLPTTRSGIKGDIIGIKIKSKPRSIDTKGGDFVNWRKGESGKDYRQPLFTTGKQTTTITYEKSPLWRSGTIKVKQTITADQFTESWKLGNKEWIRTYKEGDKYSYISKSIDGVLGKTKKLPPLKFDNPLKIELLKENTLRSVYQREQDRLLQVGIKLQQFKVSGLIEGRTAEGILTIDSKTTKLSTADPTWIGKRGFISTKTGGIKSVSFGKPKGYRSKLKISNRIPNTEELLIYHKKPLFNYDKGQVLNVFGWAKKGKVYSTLGLNSSGGGVLSVGKSKSGKSQLQLLTQRKEKLNEVSNFFRRLKQSKSGKSQLQFLRQRKGKLNEVSNIFNFRSRQIDTPDLKSGKSQLQFLRQRKGKLNEVSSIVEVSKVEIPKGLKIKTIRIPSTSTINWFITGNLGISTTKPITTTTTKSITTSIIKPITTTTIKPITTSIIKPITTTTIKPITTLTIRPITTTTTRPITTTTIRPITTPYTLPYKLPTEIIKTPPVGSLNWGIWAGGSKKKRGYYSKFRPRYTPSITASVLGISAKRGYLKTEKSRSAILSGLPIRPIIRGI